jgi:hypothetical protein
MAGIPSLDAVPVSSMEGSDDQPIAVDRATLRLLLRRDGRHNVLDLAREGGLLTTLKRLANLHELKLIEVPATPSAAAPPLPPASGQAPEASQAPEAAESPAPPITPERRCRRSRQRASPCGSGGPERAAIAPPPAVVAGRGAVARCGRSGRGRCNEHPILRDYMPCTWHGTLRASDTSLVA